MPFAFRLRAACGRSLLAAVLIASGAATARAQQTKTPADTTRKPVPQTKIAAPQTKAVVPQTKTAAPQTKTVPPQTKTVAPQTKTAPPQTTAPAAVPQTKTPVTAPQTKTAATQTKAPAPAPAPATPQGTKVAPAGGPPARANAPRDTTPVMPRLMMREVFSYDGAGRRDPFLSLLTTTDLRPTLSDLKLLMTVVDEPGRSVALVQDAHDKRQKSVRVGSKLGRMRVTSIRSDAVIFTIEQFGMNRRDSLLLRDSTKARVR